jgi:hypothetical protein
MSVAMHRFFSSTILAIVRSAMPLSRLFLANTWSRCFHGQLLNFQRRKEQKKKKKES